MPLFLIGFPKNCSISAGNLEELIKLSGGVNLWDNTWLVDFDVIPDYIRSALILTDASFVIPAETAGAYYAVSRRCSVEARSFFSERLAPNLTEPHDGERHVVARYFGQGDKWFEPIVSRFKIERARSSAPTRLCYVMSEEGSDKALGWHNYTPFYMHLFATLPAPVNTVFEVGIGSNDITVPSNMGADGRPGASLRGWQRFFPQAKVYGADVDPKALFGEGRIETFLVDQTVPDSFDQLWSELQGTSIDIFIDDGLHTFEAAKTTFDKSFGMVRKGGYYIIEDVAIHERDKIFNYISSCGYSGVEANLLHPTNKNDNCLIVIRAN